MRMLLMQKIGGSYWDSDTITLKEFPFKDCKNWIHRYREYFESFAMNFNAGNAYFKVYFESIVSMLSTININKSCMFDIFPPVGKC